ncbi:MAG: hypothetical protein ACRCXT_06655, partial [Paraclostridium sp.]
MNAFGESIAMRSKGLDSMDDVYSVMQEHEGKVITPEGVAKSDETITELRKKEENGEKLTKEDTYEYKNLTFVYEKVKNVEESK